MRTLLATILFVALGIFVNAQQATQVDGGYQIQIKTSAVCDMCKEAIESDLTFERGVKSIELDVDSKIATVVYSQRRTSPDVIRLRITEIGYHADSLRRDPEAYRNLPMCCQDGAHENEQHGLKESIDHESMEMNDQ